jgi:hypothetical protein
MQCAMLQIRLQQRRKCLILAYEQSQFLTINPMEFVRPASVQPKLPATGQGLGRTWIISLLR